LCKIKQRGNTAFDNKPKSLYSNHQALTPETSQLLCLTSVLELPTQDRSVFQCSVNDWATSVICVSVLLVMGPLVFYVSVFC